MGYDKDQAAEEFTRWSESYDRCVLQWLLFGPSHRVLIRRIAAVAGNRPFRVLDVGCGTGLFAARHQGRPARRPRSGGWTSCPGCWRRGKPRWQYHAGHVFPVQGDSERLPFASGSFDFVDLRQQLPSLSPARTGPCVEMQRVLRPGGRLMIIDGYRDAPWGWFIYDVCVALREGDVHHASARRFRELMTRPGCRPSPRKSIAASLRSCSAKASSPNRSPASPPPTSGSATKSPPQPMRRTRAGKSGWVERSDASLTWWSNRWPPRRRRAPSITTCA